MVKNWYIAGLELFDYFVCLFLLKIRECLGNKTYCAYHFNRNFCMFLDLGLNFWQKPHLSRWVYGWISDLTNLKLHLITDEKPRLAAWYG